MKYDIFISYRRKDSSGRSNVPTARQFKLAFEAPPYNYKVFFDYSECTDNYFSDTILPAIRTCDFFVLVLTKDCLLRCSNEGDWVRREIEEAVAYGRKIIPITPDKECESFPSNLPDLLSKTFDGLQITTVYTDHMFETSVDFLVKNRFHLNNVQLDSENECKAKEDVEMKITITVKDVSFDMVIVEGGTFHMGSDDNEAYSNEKPVHSVTVDSFYMSDTNVVQALWKAIMENNPSRFKGDDLPVENVSWDDCKAFICKLNSLVGKNFRLPTEAEWEYASRGGNKSKGYKYSGSDNIDSVAWHKGNSGSKTHSVKTKLPNELGLYDMSGNVMEWCEDGYGSYGSKSQTNSTGSLNATARVLRGGSWCNTERGCRVSNRYHKEPNNGFNYGGFRLVLSC